MQKSLLILLGVTLVTGCQSSTCDNLKAHAKECGSVPARYVEREQEICGVLRAELTAATFDPYAQCMVESDCQDQQAIDSCQEAHVPAASADPCLQYQLWATACGLEPSGTEDGCNGATQGLTSDVFGAWVECMTSPGCPKESDSRFAECQRYVVPSSMTDALEACGLIIDWTEACEGQTSGYLAVDAQDITSCLLQTQVFTSESLLIYGLCLQDVACSDFAMRLDCMAKLRFVDRSHTENACLSLTEYATACELELGFEDSADLCERMLAPFTEASVEAYTACIIDDRCRQPDLLVCQQMLVLKSD